MDEADLAGIEAVLPPLLRALDAFAFAARNLHPPQLAELVELLGAPDGELRAARAGVTAWPERLSALGAQLDAASEAALEGLGRLRAAAAEPDSLRHVFRAMRFLPRALEALYPLAGILPPVNRFFLNADGRADEGLQAQFLKPAPENTGVMCLSEEPDARGAVWAYVPETYSADAPAPLVMALHGGGGHGRSFLWSWVREARSRGVIVIAPTALGDTWALAGPDRDTPHLVSLLEAVQSDWKIDPARLLLTGMSDGGTFSYTSGLEGASPFTHLAPVSAAFHPMLAEMADPTRIAGLPVHIIHGDLDWMFPASMAREAAASLKSAGAAVTYREIEDLSHSYPAELNGAILDWVDATMPA